MRNIILIIGVGVSLLTLTACGADENASSGPGANATLAPVPAEYAGLTNPLSADPASAASGGEVFRTNCETCHGPQGRGDGPAGQSLEPKPGNLAALQTKAGDDYLFWRIREGKPGTSMVAWKSILTEEQIWQAVSFLRTLKE